MYVHPIYILLVVVAVVFLYLLKKYSEFESLTPPTARQLRKTVKKWKGPRVILEDDSAAMTPAFGDNENESAREREPMPYSEPRLSGEQFGEIRGLFTVISSQLDAAARGVRPTFEDVRQCDEARNRLWQVVMQMRIFQESIREARALERNEIEAANGIINDDRQSLRALFVIYASGEEMTEAEQARFDKEIKPYIRTHEGKL